jgi:hypothetical protein
MGVDRFQKRTINEMFVIDEGGTGGDGVDCRRQVGQTLRVSKEKRFRVYFSLRETLARKSESHILRCHTGDFIRNLQNSATPPRPQKHHVHVLRCTKISFSSIV